MYMTACIGLTTVYLALSDVIQAGLEPNYVLVIVLCINVFMNIVNGMSAICNRGQAVYSSHNTGNLVV